MRPFRLRFGLIAWTFVWLLVALVPSWRLGAERQLANPTGSTFYDTNSYGLTSDLEREAARRFPDDVGAQLAPLHQVQFGDLYPLPPANGEALPAKTYSPPDLDKAVKELRRRAVPYFRHYDELERRFPNSNAVRAQRLRDTTTGALIVSTFPWAKGETVPTGMQVSPVWLAKPELEASLRTAVEGARREPDNGFFPWMQATLLFALDKPDDAIKALDAAGKCARWSDGTNQTVLQRIALLRRLRAANWQDDDWEMWSALLPHLAQMRQTARAASAQMRLARRRGDEARALEIAGILQRAGGNMARCQDTLIGGLVGEAICDIARQAAIEDLPDAPKLTIPHGIPSEAQIRHAQKELRRARFQAFIAHTRAHNRPDLASEAFEIEKTLDATRLSSQFYGSQVDSAPDPILRATIQLEIASLLGAWLFWFSLAASFTWFGCWLLTLRQAGNNQARAKTIGWSFFCLGATGAILGATGAILSVALRSNPSFGSDRFGFAFSGSNPEGAPSGSPVVGLLCFLVALWIAPIALSMAWERRRKWKPRWKLEAGKPNLRPLISRGLWIIGLAGAPLSWNQSAAPFDRAFLYFWILWLLCLLIGNVLFVAWAQRERRLGRFFGLGSFWMGVFSLRFPAPDGSQQFGAYCTWALAILLALAALFFRQRAHKAEGNTKQDWLFDFLGRVRIAASVLAMGATFGYLGVALWTMPIEARAEAQLDRQLQIGEPAFLREQLPMKNPAPS